ncbi:uncharacterized protein [Miscanthus floridulus]|uniref:uncharacterized protein n=1 Tax=Miscanthus floridulus TaxID=154761 RepID=UPI00345A3131
MREDPDASSPRRQDPSNGEPCRVALRERPRWRWSPRRALPATSSCASGPRSGGGGGDLGHATRGCARKARLLPLAVGGDLQMESTFALEETLAAVFAQICNRSSRRCLCRLGRCGIRPALGASDLASPFDPLSTKDCTSQIEETPQQDVAQIDASRTQVDTRLISSQEDEIDEDGR